MLEVDDSGNSPLDLRMPHRASMALSTATLKYFMHTLDWMTLSSRTTGRPIEQIPQMRTRGVVPGSIADIVTLRQHSPRCLLWDNFAPYTGDAIAYHPDGSLKLILDAQPLKELVFDSHIINGALALSDDQYNALEGMEYRPSPSNEPHFYFNRASVSSDPLLQFLLRDHSLLGVLAEFTADRADGMLGIMLQPTVGEQVTLRSLQIMMYDVNKAILHDFVYLDRGGYDSVFLRP